MSFDGWKEHNVSELVDIIGGGTPKTGNSNYWDGDIPWLSVKDFNSDKRYVYVTEKTITEEGLKNSSTKFLNKEDIIISARGTVGAMAQLGRPMTFNQSCYGIKAKEMTTNNFIYYSLKNIIQKIKMNTHGSVFDTITKNTFKLLKVTLPPLDEQKSIANILSSLDEKIEINNQINETLENMTHELFKRWFVDFEFPNEDGEPYQSSGGEMVDSELGLIPKGWDALRISDICDVRDGTHDSPKAVDEGYYLITSKHLKNSYIEFSDAKFISENDYHKVNERSKVDRYDILITMIGTVGNIYLVQDEEIDFAIKNIGLFKTSANLNYYEFIYLLLKSKEMQQYIEQRLAGSTQNYISLTELRKLPLVAPTKEVLKEFRKISNNILDMIYCNEKENNRLRLIRDEILPKLMSGEIRVPLEELLESISEVKGG